MDRDVIVSSFNPLHIDNDFGAGKAYFYDLDLLPSLTMYQHIHRGNTPYTLHYVLLNTSPSPLSQDITL
jgi:hypothetical protein